MPKDFKYDVILLIQSVRNRPCLWDKTLENYKDRVERRTAWEEIFSILDPNYEQLSSEDKRITEPHTYRPSQLGELILNKWTNIRDTFIKTLKVRMGKPKKKYLFHDQLKFLTNVTREEECPVEYNVDVPLSFFKLEREERTRTNGHGRKRARHTEDEEDGRKSQQSRDLDQNSDLDLMYVNETNDPRVMNEDEAFFASLLPTVVKYNEDERLEFRMEVLGVMKTIKEKRKWHEN